MIDEELRGSSKSYFFSAATFNGRKITEKAINDYASGQVLDVGCGTMPFKDLIKKNSNVNEYHTIDIEKRVPMVDFVGDAQNMDMIENNTYDTLLCIEVLDHVQNPYKVLNELKRIIKDGGYLILSVPHLSRLHEEPHDYYRFTKYGLKFLFENAGFNIIDISPRGGLFSFLGHQFSTVFLCFFWHIPILKNIIFFINKWFCILPCCFLDKYIDKGKKFALGYTVVAQGNESNLSDN